MKECIIVGRPNTGKTLFALNFAGYLGSRNVDITFRAYDDLLSCRHMSIEQAKRELCGSIAHKTLSMQSMLLRVPVAKTTVTFKLTDTCGLIGDIHPEEIIRRGMSQTLKSIRSADLIFHLINLVEFGEEPDIIDLEIYNYGQSRHNYILLANKADLAGAIKNVPQIQRFFPLSSVIVLSALTQYGFKEVKSHVARNV